MEAEILAKRKIWNIHKIKRNVQESLARELNISPTLAMLLANRGYCEGDEAREFLEPKLEYLTSPLKLNNMVEAISKIKLAIEEQKKIIIYGDYDVDGLTSTALLTQVFHSLGVNAEYYIPDRVEEGYGLNIDALRILASEGAKLIITVDCGISSKTEVALGQKLGLDFIITDHHQPPEELPDCLIINPQLEKGNLSWKNLSGVGVAFKLAQGLVEDFLGKSSTNKLLPLLDLVALGTIADIVPLIGENRILVKYGLEQIATGNRLGIRALCENAGLDVRNITSSNIGYILAPRLNACGRIGNAYLGVKILLTASEIEARDIAHQLSLENQNRQNIESKIVQEAIEIVDNQELHKNKVIVLAGQGWHPGVIGIVASRLVEKYFRPVIILTKQNELYKGSGRSIPNFHLHQALTACSDLLESFGGHSQAAGLSLREENIEKFIKGINDFAIEILTERDFVPNLNLDGEINLAEAGFDLLEEMTKLEPFGCANPEPLLIYRRSEIKDYKEVGNKGGHLKLKVKAGKSLWDAIGFNMAGHLELAASHEPLDLAFSLDNNNWNGKTTLQLILKDMKLSRETDNPYIEPNFLERLFLEGPKFLIDDNFQDMNTKESPNRLNDCYSPADLVFIDERGCNDKIGYIKKFFLIGEKSIVFVNSRNEAYNLAADLRRDLPLYKDKIAYYHGGLNEQDRQGVKDLWCDDQLQLLITTSSFSIDKDAPTIENIFFYHLCFSRGEHKHVISWGCSYDKIKTKIHLLYGPKDKEFCHFLIAGISPQREQLAKFYVMLKKLAKKSNPIIINDDQLAQWANIYKIFGAQAKFMGTWLNIFRELGLIQCEYKANYRKVFIESAPSKVNLEDSLSFVEGALTRDSFLEYIQLAFKEDPLEIIN